MLGIAVDQVVHQWGGQEREGWVVIGIGHAGGVADPCRGGQGVHGLVNLIGTEQRGALGAGPAGAERFLFRLQLVEGEIGRSEALRRQSFRGAMPAVVVGKPQNRHQQAECRASGGSPPDPPERTGSGLVRHGQTGPQQAAEPVELPKGLECLEKQEQIEQDLRRLKGGNALQDEEHRPVGKIPANPKQQQRVKYQQEQIEQGLAELPPLQSFQGIALADGVVVELRGLRVLGQIDMVIRVDSAAVVPAAGAVIAHPLRIRFAVFPAPDGLQPVADRLRGGA